MTETASGSLRASCPSWFARSLIASVLTVGLLCATAASASSATARTVSFHGYRLSVPGSWPIFDLARDPATCVRFDRHALYLGTPGADQRCPADAVGRTEAILLSPLRAGEAAALRAGRRGGAAGTPSAPAIGGGDSTTILLGRSGLAATVTWSGDRALVSAIVHRHLSAPPAARAPTATRTPTAHARGALASRPLAHPAEAVDDGLGFDACAAPSTSVMADWTASPYRAVGVYVGGVNQACAQPNLSSAWVATVVAGGWHLIPTYVGYQGAGACGGSCATITAADAAAEGTSDATAAVAAVQALGIPAGNPIYDDMEQFTASPADVSAVLTYLSAWTTQLHADGYLSGVYGSAASAISDLATEQGTGYAEPDDIWIADWNDEQTTADPYVPATDWPGAERLHQYEGGHNATYDGATLNIDSDFVDGATADVTPPIPDGTFVTEAGEPYVYRIAGGAPTYVSSWAPFGGPQAVQTLTPDAFDSLPQYPASGTFVETTGAQVYRIVGGAPIAVSSLALFADPPPVPDTTIDEWDVQNTSSCLSHLQAAPADGTVVEGLPADDYWSFTSGVRTVAAPTPTAITVDDLGLASFAVATTIPGGAAPTTTVATVCPPLIAPTPIVVPPPPPPPVRMCVVPRLKHLTLKRAKSELVHADCRLGVVRAPRRVRRGRVLHVFGQSVAAHRSVPAGDRINLRLL